MKPYYNLIYRSYLHFANYQNTLHKKKKLWPLSHKSRITRSILSGHISLVSFTLEQFLEVSFIVFYRLDIFKEYEQLLW